jgi:hypothetical protein
LAWLTYVVCTAAALLTHSTAVFLPIAANLFVLGLMGWRRQAMRRHRASPIASGRRYVWGDWVSLRNWLIAQALVLLLWSPWSVPFAIQAGGVYREFWIPRPSAGTILALIGTFLGTHLLGSVFWATVAAALLLPIAALGGISLRRQPAVLVFLLTFLLTPIAGELLVSLRRPIFYDRTLIWASIPFYLLSAAGLARLRLGLSHCERSRALPALTLISALALLVAVNGLSLHGYYVDFQKEGWREAATYVTGQAKTGDLVLFNATWVQIPFDYYFQGTRRGVSERGAPANLFDRGVLEPKMTAGDLPRLYGLIQDRDRVWLVYSHNWYTDPEGLIPPALDQELTLLERREFTGLEIRLYARKTGQS